jgi:hypothetical protein
MGEINLIKPEKISLLNHPELNERWVQEIIANDPSVLGLGDLILKDKERNQPKSGRLDLLLQDIDSERRYEVEIQLGKTDESHIIRTIEYWDNERKRYSQYDHIAVIVAEDITSRFLNVVGLFNNSIPLVAIQMNAFRNDDKYWITFTTILDEIKSGNDEEEVREIADRNYWEKRGTSNTVAMADYILNLISEFAPGYELKYNKFYIGLAKDGQPDNFVAFKPRKNNLYLELRMNQSKEISEKIENTELELFKYDSKWGKYHLRLTKSDLEKQRGLVIELLKAAYENKRYTDE